MGRLIWLIAALALTLVAASRAGAVTIDWVPVGNPGNPADTRVMTNDHTSGYGSVSYNYSIDKYDVTVGQYTDFLNSVAKTDSYLLYDTNMATELYIAGIARGGSSGSYSYSVIGSSANLPITFVSWGDAARFANWLQNGQPTGAEGPGTTETGAYTLNGATTIASLNAVTRNPDAMIVIPSESEWYKAAFYDPVAGHYWNYATGTNTRPTSAVPGSSPNTANFYDNTTGYAVTHSTNLSSTQNYLTAVGAYTASASAYGTYDQSGDVFQWNEALFSLNNGAFRGLRGGSWTDNSDYLPASMRNGYLPTGEFANVGFRVAMVPEPSTAVLAVLGLAGLIAWGWRRQRARPS